MRESGPLCPQVALTLSAVLGPKYVVYDCWHELSLQYFLVVVAKEVIEQFENYSNNQATKPQNFNPLYYQIQCQDMHILG
jgi:hypothetical protein